MTSIVRAKGLPKTSKFFAAVAALGLSAWISISAAQAFPVQVATAPESTLPLIISAIQSARQSLQINIYELASPEITQAIIQQINRGVQVEILQEGEPVGGIPQEAQALHQQIAQAMKAHLQSGNRYVEMRASSSGFRRFHFDHAKYIVIDHRALLIGSENYAPTGHPEPGTQGNRGWEVLVEDAQPAQWFSALFEKDSDLKNADLQSMIPVSNHAHVMTASSPHVVAPARTNPVYEASDGQIITSPDNSLTGIVALIQNARSSIDIEQMSFNLNWSQPSEMSPIATALLAAARRGVHVRILLNDENAFAHAQGGDHVRDQERVSLMPDSSSQSTGNQKTVDALMAQAQKERLPISAKIANIQAMGVTYIHNKGMIIDRQTTLICSINWTENSIQGNREAGVAITSPAVAAYFGHFFESDWGK